jgi:hypothetical protein
MKTPGSRSIVWRVKSSFFDAPAMQAALGAVMHSFLGASGAMIQKIAQRSMRYRGPYSHSPAGNPPFAHKGKRGPLLREMLFFGIDPGNMGLVVGPIRFGIRPVPAMHEVGGRYRIANPRRRLRRVGDAGEIRIVETAAPGDFAAMPGVERGMIRSAVYARLRTPAQARRATRINRELYGDSHVVADYPARPYMAPAKRIYDERYRERLLAQAMRRFGRRSA